jgi:hypothetical protein
LTAVAAEALMEMIQVGGVYVFLIKTQASKPRILGAIAHTDGLQEAGDRETTHIRAVNELDSLKVLKLGGERGLVQTLSLQRRTGVAYIQVSHAAAVS